MNQKNESTPKNESQPAAGEPLPAQQPVDNEADRSSQPAGAARGSDLPPQGQGSPHPPAEPTGKSLAEQFEGGPVLPDVPLPDDPDTGEPAEEPQLKNIHHHHMCSICGSPNHQACGCEAKALQKAQEQEYDQAGSGLDQELKSDEVRVEQILENVFGNEPTKMLTQMAGEMSGALLGGVDKFEEFKSGVLDRLSEIQIGIEYIGENTKALVKLQKERADLLKDIQDGKPN